MFKRICSSILLLASVQSQAIPLPPGQPIEWTKATAEVEVRVISSDLQKGVLTTCKVKGETSVFQAPSTDGVHFVPINGCELIIEGEKYEVFVGTKASSLDGKTTASAFVRLTHPKTKPGCKHICAPNAAAVSEGHVAVTGEGITTVQLEARRSSRFKLSKESKFFWVEASVQIQGLPQ